MNKPLEARCPTCDGLWKATSTFGCTNPWHLPGTAPLEALGVILFSHNGMPITEARAKLPKNSRFKAAYEAPDPEYEAEKAAIDAAIEAQEVEARIAEHPELDLEKVQLCKGCNTAKHVNSDGLCGRCAPEATQGDELARIINQSLARIPIGQTRITFGPKSLIVKNFLAWHTTTATRMAIEVLEKLPRTENDRGYVYINSSDVDDAIAALQTQLKKEE